MQTELIKQLDSVLKTFPKYWNDKGVLQRTVVITDIQNKNPELLRALIEVDPLV